MLTDAQWMELEPLVEAVRPRAKVPPRHLRRTVGAILWRHDNGAKWRSLPAEHGPWWMAAQTFIRWSRLGVLRPLRGLSLMWTAGRCKCSLRNDGAVHCLWREAWFSTGEGSGRARPYVRPD